MEVLSRVEKHKTKKKGTPESLYWFGCLLLFAVIFYAFIRYVTIPVAIPLLQTMEMSLFFCAILFLDLYLLAFTYISTKSFSFLDEKNVRAKYYIITAWVISLLYHFVLWMMSQGELRRVYYQIGIAISLCAFLFTLGHFFSFFSTVKYYHQVYNKSLHLENRRQVYELLKGILNMYHLIRDVMDKDPEIFQMMRWNQFDVLLEQMAQEAQPYVQISSFRQEDLEKLIGVKLWMENIMMIIQQHPRHKDILKQAQYVGGEM